MGCRVSKEEFDFCPQPLDECVVCGGESRESDPFPASVPVVGE